MLARINVMLMVLLVICALGLVISQHRARKLFVDLERAQSNATAHEVRWNQLQVEQTELAKAARIDARARKDFGMQAVQPDRTLHLSVDPVSRAVSLSQPWIEPAAGGARAGVRATAAGGQATRGQATSGQATRGQTTRAPAARTPAAGQGASR
jgi:cell division protein FtsL